MKKNILLIVSLFGFFASFANINFALDYALFRGENNQNYAEFYLSINGNSILYAETSPNLFQANLEVTYLIEQGEQVVTFEKFLLKSPEYTPEDQKLDLIDLKRIPLPQGDYTYTLVVKDLIAKTEAIITDELRQLPTKNQLQFSEIQLANEMNTETNESVFLKNGYDIIPNISHVYNDFKNTLIAYFEIYDANKSLTEEETYLVDIKIEDAFTSVIPANLRTVKRMTAKDVSPLIQQFDISKLPSGSYNFVVEAKDKSNQTIAKQIVGFYRLNSNIENLDVVTTEGSFVDTMRNIGLLTEYIKSLRPISNEVEKVWADNQLRYAELELMQRYFLNFWKDRNQIDPYFEWQQYKAKVEFVDREFGYGGVNGYSTERGRVYLQYGPPTTVQNVKYDSDNHPYSIWQYNKLNGLTNRRFVFYSPSNETLGYEVIHSNVPGEIQNEDWEYSINKRNVTTRPARSQSDDPNFQQRAKDLYNNPR